MAKPGTWPKGVSGNPTGRRPGKSFALILRELEEQEIGEWQHPDHGVIKSPLTMAIIQTVSAAQNGEPWAIKEILDRCLGKPRESLDINVDNPAESAFDRITKDERAQFIAELRAIRASLVDRLPDSGAD